MSNEYTPQTALNAAIEQRRLASPPARQPASASANANEASRTAYDHKPSAMNAELDSTNIVRRHTQQTLRRQNEHHNVDDDDEDDEDEDDDGDGDDELDFADVQDHSGGRPHNTTDTKDCVDFMMPSSVRALSAAAAAIGGVGGGGGASDGDCCGEHSRDEPDHLQHRFSRNLSPQHQHHQQQQQQQQQHHNNLQHNQLNYHMNSAWNSLSNLRQLHDDDGGGGGDDCGGGGVGGADSCPSELSSAISSPAPSTVSSPLSTPTRIVPQQYKLQHSHQHCCQQKTTPNSSTFAHHHQQQQQHHHHRHHHHPDNKHQHHHHQHHHHHSVSSSAALSTAAAVSAGAGAPTSGAAAAKAAATANACKKLQKHEPRFSPSRYRQLLPIVVCILSFALVFTILIIYMDTTELRHKQFRLNMSRDYDLSTVSQDDPQLIAFLREIHMRKSPRSKELELASAIPSASPALLNFTMHDELTPNMAHYVANLVGGKMNGAVIQSLPGALGQLMTAPWLSETLNWAGIIVEPEPRRYFTLRKQNAHRAHMQVVHACVSPNTYPKEISIHNDEVRINSLLDEETTWFTSRVKCFPLYSIMRACNRVEYDLLSLGVNGHELHILQTLPFDKIKIDVISIHLLDDYEDKRSYVQKITKFLMGKSYKMQKKFGCNYFYQRINATNRTRKKDILLLKTP